MTRVKICCITSVAEAEMAIAHSADALGLVSDMPSGPGPIDDALIAEIAARVPPPVATVLLTRRTEADAIIEHVRACGTNTVQLVDAVAPATHAAVKRALPAVRIVQVVHVQDRRAIDEARALGSHADALLLDSGRPQATVRELGGTGRTHDWWISREIVELSLKPVFLAGGLNAGNVGKAIRAARPYGVDLCSGVRTDGALDPAKLNAFIAAVRSALGRAVA